jgi:hypothetical protein
VRDPQPTPRQLEDEGILESRPSGAIVLVDSPEAMLAGWKESVKWCWGRAIWRAPTTHMPS